MRDDSAGKAGFSLIETLIALIVLTFGLLAAGQLIFIAASSASLARSKGSAAVVAQDKIHYLGDLYSRNPDSPDLAVGDHGPEPVQVVGPATNTVLNRFRVSWSVAPVPDPRAGKSLKARLVTVTVTPADEHDAPHYRAALNKIVTVSAIFSARISI